MSTHRRKGLSIAFRIVVCTVLIGGGTAIYLVLKATKPTPAESGDVDAAPRVNVMAARRVPVPRVWTGYGTAGAMDKADVPARVSATVVALADGVVEGASVRRGALLVSLDTTDFERRAEIVDRALDDVSAQLAQLEIEAEKWVTRAELASEAVALARADYDRAVEAQRRDAVKEREVDRARQALIAAIRDEVGVEQELESIPQRRVALTARREGLESELRLTRVDLERCAITSPLDGTLQSLDVEIGESVAPGVRVARVVSIARIEIPVRVPASARGRVDLGDSVQLHAAGGGAWDASIVRIAPEDDPGTRTMTVFAELDQDPGGAAAAAGMPLRLAPGRFVRAVVREEMAPMRWVVPRRAIEGDRIRVVLDGRVQSRPIEIDFQVETDLAELGPLDRHWVVLAGEDVLREGELVVVNAGRRLEDGLLVAPDLVGADR